MEIYDKMAMELNRLLWGIMKGCQVHRQGWTLSIKTIIVPYDLKISDAHLLYIYMRGKSICFISIVYFPHFQTLLPFLALINCVTCRTPSLERLLLLGTYEITCAGFGKAIQNWISDTSWTTD